MNETMHRHYSLGYFNTARAVGVLVVIVGHSMALFLNYLPAPAVIPVFSGAGRVIGGGVMAMLFMVSGFYFQRRPVKRCIALQTRMLLKPYYLTGGAILVWMGVRALVRNVPFAQTGSKLFFTFLLGTNASKATTLFGVTVGTVSLFWFLLALYWGWILFNFISFISDFRIRLVLLGGCVVLSRIMISISSVWPMALPMALLAAGYIAVGYNIRTQRLLDWKLPLSIRIPMAVIALVSMAFGYVDIAACQWKLGLVDMAGSFCVGYLLLVLYSKLMDGPLGMRLFARMDNMGIHAVKIMCFHAFEKEVIPWKKLADIFPDRPILCILVCMLGRFLLIQILILLLERTRRYFRRKKRVSLTVTEE